MTTLTQDVILRLRRLPPALQYEAALRLRRTVPPTSYPTITEQVWKSDPYMTLWGGWNVPQSSYGKEWGATGEGDGHQNGPVLIDSYGIGLHTGKLLDNCRVMGIGSTCSSKFGRRAYNQVNPTTRKTEFSGRLLEHYEYVGILQGGLWEDCRFGKLGEENANGAAIQVALRNIVDAGIDYTMETQNAELSQVETTRTYRRCEFNHIGKAGSQRWGAFTVSEHPGQLQIGSSKTAWINTHIRIEDCPFIGGHVNYVDGNGQLVQSGRAILCSNRPSITLQNVKIDYPNPHDGWSGRIAWTPVVRIVKGPDSLMRDGKLEILGADSINVDAGIPGACKLLVRDKAGSTVYEGALSNGYSFGVKP